MFKQDTETLRRYLIMAALVLVLLVIAILLYSYAPSLFSDVLSFLGLVLFPFAIAWLAAIFTRPMINWLCKSLRFSRSAAVVFMMLICLAALGGLVTMLTLVIVDVVGDLRLYFSDTNNAVMDVVHQIQDIYGRLNMDFEQLQSMLSRVGEFLGQYAGDSVSAVWDIAKATPTYFLLIIVALVAIFYWCRDEEVVKRLLVTPFSAAKRKEILRTYDSISQVLGNYLRAQLFLVTISIIICIAGLSILRLENSITMGFLAGSLDVIPMLGPGTILIPWAVWLLLTGEYLACLGLIVVFFSVILIRNLIQPKILSDSMGVHPLLMLASLFIGMRLFGAVGLIIGPVGVSLAQVLYREKRKHSKKTPPPTAPPPNLPPSGGN